MEDTFCIVIDHLVYINIKLRPGEQNQFNTE